MAANVIDGALLCMMRHVDLGGTVFVSSPADFGAFMAAYTEKWAKVIKFAGIKAE